MIKEASDGFEERIALCGVAAELQQHAVDVTARLQHACM